MKSEYRSPKSVAKNPTIPIDVNDPRLSKNAEGPTRARSGAEIQVVDFSGRSLAAVYANQVAASPVSAPPQWPTYQETTKPLEKVKLGAVSNLSVTWSGDDLLFEFDFDTKIQDNKYAYEVIVDLTTSQSSGSKTGSSSTFPGMFLIDQNLTHHSYTLTRKNHTDILEYFYPDIANFCVKVSDKYKAYGQAACDVPPEYTIDINPPVITATSTLGGYKVTITNDTEILKSAFANIDIWEIESNDGTAPEITYLSDGITPSNYQRVYLDQVNPAMIISPNLLKRWIVARFSTKSGIYTAFSEGVSATPTGIGVDLTPPNEVTEVSAVWSGNNIVISYTLPTQDVGVRFVAALTPPGTNPPVGYFYIFPDGTSNLNQTATITKADLFNQFGEYYSSFSGTFKSIDAADNRSGGVSFSVASRVNPLSGIVPTFTAVNIINGFTVTFTKPAAASYAEIYRKYTSWTSSDSDVDYFTATAGTSSTNQIVLSDIRDNHGNLITNPLPTGYLVEGSGVPAGTWITGYNNGQSKITVNNTVSISNGTVLTLGALVYAGPSPAVIQDTTYADIYVKIRYYDEWGNHSEYSAESTARALNPITVDINPPATPAAASATSGIDESGILGFNGYINVSWTKVTDSTVRGYRIRYTTDTVDPIYTYVDSPGNDASSPTFKLTGLVVGATYDIAVATYDEFNNTSTYTSIASGVEISGTPTMANYITAGDYGFKFGTKIDVSETKSGILFNDSNYWYMDGSGATLNVGSGTPSSGTNYLNWNGTKLSIDGDMTARGGSFSGNILMSTSGASIYNGTLTSGGALSGDGFILNSGGLLVRKGSNFVELTASDGGLYANYGRIANWYIKTNQLENTLGGASTTYVGLSSSPSATYAFWAGSSVSGGDIENFAVTPQGKMYAKGAQISGGTLDVGDDWPDGFHVHSDGSLKAASVELVGKITASSGSFTGNLSIESAGSVYSLVSGAEPSGTPPTSNSKGFVLNSSGLQFNSETIPGITRIYAETGLFVTSYAQIGEWDIDQYTIKKTSLGNYGSIILQSGHDTTQTAIYATNSSGTYTAGILGPTSVTTSPAFWAGNVANPEAINVSTDDLAPDFYVSFGGKLLAKKATIRGIITANEGYIGGETGWQITTNTITGNSSSVITGGKIRTAESGTRLEISSQAGNGDLSFYVNGYESYPGHMKMGTVSVAGSSYPYVSIKPPSASGLNTDAFSANDYQTYIQDVSGTQKIALDPTGVTIVNGSNNGVTIIDQTPTGQSARTVRNIIATAGTAPTSWNNGDIWVVYS